MVLLCWGFNRDNLAGDFISKKGRAVVIRKAPSKEGEEDKRVSPGRERLRREGDLSSTCEEIREHASGEWEAEMTRRCSHCSNNGHNSRTCPGRGGGLRLFGVRLMEGVGAMKKSASMGCLPSASTSSITSPSNFTSGYAASASPSGDPLGDAHLHSPVAAASGYASDDPAHGVSSNLRSERKKGEPFLFLVQIDSW